MTAVALSFYVGSLAPGSNLLSTGITGYNSTPVESNFEDNG